MFLLCKKHCIAFVFTGLFFSAVYSQTNKYTLAGLIEASANYLPSLLQKQALVSSAEAAVKDVKHSFLPRLYAGDELTIGTDNSLAGSYLPEVIVPSVSAGVTDANNYHPATGNIATFYGEYRLLNFGLHTAQINNAMSLVNFGKADFQKELYLTKLQICQLYFNLLQNQYRLKIDAQNIDRYQDVFRVIRALTLSGITAGADSSLAKAELSSAKVSYNQTLGKINQLKEQLAFFTGIASAHLDIDTLKTVTDISNLFILNISMDTVNNPLIDYYTKQKDIFLSNEKVIIKNYLPKVLLGISGFARGSSIHYNNDYKSLSTGLGYQRLNYIAGIGISYDLFSGIYKRDKLAINRYQIKASDYALQQQKLALQSSSLQADAAVKTAETNLLELPNQSKAAMDVYLQKVAQYKAGLITLIDLTNANFVLYRSQTDFIEAINDWYTAKLFKAEATGNLDLFIQSIK
ncbi:MAG: TolC family protein [Bacteroidota bacterium]|nr:TolC family protein [Bacteroidota bacterium]